LTILGRTPIIARVRPAVLVALVAVLSTLISACGRDATTSPQTPGNLQRIVAPKPPAPASTNWVPDSSQQASLGDLSHALRRGDLNALGPGSTAYFFKLKRAGLQRYYVTSWSDGSASASVFVFLDAAGARAGLRALHDFSHNYDRVRKHGDRDLPARGLGPDAWATVSRSGAGKVLAAFDAWRRGTLMLYADMDCTRACPFDVVRAAHNYARAIDAQAMRR
jgi:hypothetical protein